MSKVSQQFESPSGQPTARRKHAELKLEELWNAQSLSKGKPLEMMIRETMLFSRINRRQAIAELVQKIESLILM